MYIKGKKKMKKNDKKIRVDGSIPTMVTYYLNHMLFVRQSVIHLEASELRLL